jgi:hypothetical protein
MKAIYFVVLLFVSVRALAVEPFEIKVPWEGFTNRVGREGFAKQLDDYFKLIETLLRPITPTDEAWAKMEQTKVLGLGEDIRTGRVDRKTLPKSALSYPTNQIFIDFSLRQDVRQIRKDLSEIIDRSYLKETETQWKPSHGTNVLILTSGPFEDCEEFEILHWSSSSTELAYQIENLANKLDLYREGQERRYPSLEFSPGLIANLVESTGFKVLIAFNEAILKPYMVKEWLRKTEALSEAHNEALMKESKSKDADKK